MTFRSRKSGATLVEVLVALSIFLLLMLLVVGIVRFSQKAVQGSLEPQADLQQATQRALLVFLKELEECIEFARPAPGSTLTYFVGRGKLNEIVTGYQEQDTAASTRAGRPLYQFYLHRYDPSNPSASKRDLMVSKIERLTFTSRSPGLLQVHMRLFDGGKSYALLTTVRARGVLSEAQL